jgi:hypothetical protein
MGYDRTDRYGRKIGTSSKGMFGTNHYDKNGLYSGRTSSGGGCYDKSGNRTGTKSKDLLGNTWYTNKDGSKRMKKSGW